MQTLRTLFFRMGVLLHQGGGHGHSHGGGGHGHSHGGGGHGHSHGGHKSSEENINVRAAFIHVLGDLIQSLGVLVAAFIIKFNVSCFCACCSVGESCDFSEVGHLKLENANLFGEGTAFKTWQRIFAWKRSFLTGKCRYVKHTVHNTGQGTVWNYTMTFMGNIYYSSISYRMFKVCSAPFYFYRVPIQLLILPGFNHAILRNFHSDMRILFKLFILSITYHNLIKYSVLVYHFQHFHEKERVLVNYPKMKLSSL